jgi:predicted Zn-dependent protease
LKQIQEIGDRVTTANGLPQQKYYLVRDETHNAFVINGHVFVTTGIVPVLKNKDGAAMVLGHEIGHALAGTDFAILETVIYRALTIYLF